jgi:hypothetical protein
MVTKKTGSTSLWGRNIEFGFRHGKFDLSKTLKLKCRIEDGIYRSRVQMLVLYMKKQK